MRVTVSEYADIKKMTIGQVYARIRAGRVFAVNDGQYWVYPEKTEELLLALAEEETAGRRGGANPQSVALRVGKVTPIRQVRRKTTEDYLAELKAL